MKSKKVATLTTLTTCVGKNQPPDNEKGYTISKGSKDSNGFSTHHGNGISIVKSKMGATLTTLTNCVGKNQPPDNEKGYGVTKVTVVTGSNCRSLCLTWLMPEQGQKVEYGDM